MGDPRNWTDRKVAQVRAANAAADKAELATCELYDHGPDLMALPLTPCTTFNYLHFQQVDVECIGCLRVRRLPWAALARTAVSHDPWWQVFRVLLCDDCGHGPKEVRFQKDAQERAKWGRIARTPAPPRRRLV